MWRHLTLHRFNADETMFLGEPPASEATEAAYTADRDSDGYVGNVPAYGVGNRIS
jgi:hypothetical protein